MDRGARYKVHREKSEGGVIRVWLTEEDSVDRRDFWKVFKWGTMLSRL